MSIKKIEDFLSLGCATGLGSGFLPSLVGFPGVGGGTIGSFVACGISIIIIQFTNQPATWLVGLTAVSLISGAYTIERAEKLLGPRVDLKHRIRTHDQNEIVIDEWVAVFLMSAGLIFLLPLLRTPSLIVMAIIFGTFLFRAIDIAKPWPLSRLEKLSGWQGVMLDDVFGGIISLCLIVIGTFVLLRLM